MRIPLIGRLFHHPQIQNQEHQGPDLAEANIRLDALNWAMINNPRFHDIYAGKHIIVEKGDDGKYHIHGFTSQRKADKYCDNSPQRNCMTPMYIFKPNEVFMGSMGIC